MNSWVDAINMELQPFETGQVKKGPKVDIKAFDEVYYYYYYYCDHTH